MINRKSVELFPKQFEVINFKTQFALACAGKQSGKTFVGACWVGKKIAEFPEQMTGAIIAPSYKILHQSTLPKLFNLFPNLRQYYKEHKGEIVLSEEAGKEQVIFTRSADDPYGIEGMSPNFIWLDEAGQMKRLIWSGVRGRVSMTQGQVLLTTTPYNMGWLYQEYYLPWKNKEDSTFSFFNWKSIDNPQFPIEFYEAEKKRLTPEEFARNYCGEFKKMEGLVYNLNSQQLIEAGKLREFIRNPTKKPIYIAGIDWGFANPAGILIICFLNDKYYIIDEWKQKGKTTQEIITKLKMFMKMYSISRFYPDCAEPDRIKEMEYSGIQSESVTKDIKGGISFMQQLFNENRIIVNHSCKEFLDEINSYHYSKDKITEYPVKDNDHLMDCLRYAIFTFGYNPISEIDLTDDLITDNY